MNSFNPVEFQPKNTNSTQPEKVPDVNTIKFSSNHGAASGLCTAFEQEVKAAAKGESPYRTGPAIQLDGRSGSTVLNALDVFRDNPNLTTLNGFIACTAQDLGTDLALVFKKWAITYYEHGTKEAPKKVEITERDFSKEINTVVKRLFKTTYRSMNPMEYEQLEKSSSELARIIDEAVIARTEKLQKAVVLAFKQLDEKLNKLEEQPVPTITVGTATNFSPDEPLKSQLSTK